MNTAIPQTGQPISLEGLDKAIGQVNWAQPTAAQIASIANMRIAMPDTAGLRQLDPFSDRYRAKVLDMYQMLRDMPREQKGDYDPFRDELTPAGNDDDIFSGLAPWHIKGTTNMSEHLLSWGHILMRMDLQQGSVLEYGPGSGQLLLILARLGISVYGVDIDQRWLNLIDRQAKAMGLAVNLERATFGSGFDGQTFDRIIFYEAFHHALDFVDVLQKLRGRLNKKGFILFCGEPIVPKLTDYLPYPWGLRLDGDSVRCIRHHGWMELGFTYEFFQRALIHCGYVHADFPLPGTPRAHVYMAMRKEDL